jgi:Dolichyl-phosphate-mannose-protein mannosyltransferase
VQFRSPLLPAGLVTLALLLALGHAALAVRASRGKSTTSDEIAHLTGGYTFNHWQDFRLHPENGLLPQRWQALPLGFGPTLGFPSLASDEWRDSHLWWLGHSFFYEQGNDHERMLASARSMNSLFGAATLLLVFFWSWRLWGPAGAVISAVLGALCPTMLAHSGLATSDMAATFFLLASTGAYWRHLHDSRRRWWLLSAATFGLACVAKYTAVLLLPIFGLLLAIRAFHPQPLVLAGRSLDRPPAKLLGLALSLLTHGAAAIFTIWAFCGFRYTAFNPGLPAGAFSLPWAFVLNFGGFKAQVIELCRTAHLLPEAWLYGLAFVLKHAEARGAFLDGDYSIFGWVSFFPKAFFYKTPLSLLAAVVGTAGLVGLSWRPAASGRAPAWLYRTAPLLVFFIVYWVFSLTSHLNIGHRHILPTYPVLYVFCGGLGWAAVRAVRHSRAGGWAFILTIALLLGWHGRIAAGIHPHYLAYFSPLAGGPAEGYRHLVDSSLDWGQDLGGLAKWLETGRRPGETVHLAYFGTSEPDYYGIQATRLPSLNGILTVPAWYEPKGGLYCISATMLQQVYSSYRGPWTPEQEKSYQEGRAKEPLFREYLANPTVQAELRRLGQAAAFEKTWTYYDALRFARLCHYLRARQPLAMIGYSILIYRLSADEVDAALYRRYSELLEAGEPLRKNRP